VGVDVDRFGLDDGVRVWARYRSEEVGVGNEGFMFVLRDDGESGLRDAKVSVIREVQAYDERMRRDDGNDYAARREGPAEPMSKYRWPRTTFDLLGIQRAEHSQAWWPFPLP
jgi:hypothetical protein